MVDDLLNALAIPIPISGRRAFVLGRVVAANAYSSDNFTSRQLYYMKFSYKICSHRMGKGD